MSRNFAAIGGRRFWTFICVLLFYFVVLTVVNWDHRHQFARLAEKYIAIPPGTNVIYANMTHLEHTIGDSLSVTIDKPNGDDDPALREWLRVHNHLSEWKPTFKTMVAPLGLWEATKGKVTYIFRRLDDSGRVSLTFVQRIPDLEIGPSDTSKSLH